MTKIISPTTTLLGIDEKDEPLVRKLSNAPHVLVTGSTGSGKSITLHQMMISMMAHTKPEDIQFALVDPKKVEFSMYKDNPYLMTDPITDMLVAYDFFQYLNVLMDERYENLAEASTPTIDEYNKKKKWNYQEIMKHIVVIVDEYNDLVMEVPEIDKLITRIAKKSRAVGIHMILATQSPRANVITGNIKANFPVVMAHKADNSTESAIALNEKGAEKLNERGEMLIKWHNNGLVKAQSTFISQEELTDIIKHQRSAYRTHKVDWIKHLKERTNITLKSDFEWAFPIELLGDHKDVFAKAFKP